MAREVTDSLDQALTVARMQPEAEAEEVDTVFVVERETVLLSICSLLSFFCFPFEVVGKEKEWTSRIQYARLRTPISMLRTLVTFSSATALLRRFLSFFPSCPSFRCLRLSRAPRMREASCGFVPV